MQSSILHCSFLDCVVGTTSIHDKATKGLYPAKHSKTLAWYVCPGGKGVTITEVEGAPADEVAFENWLMWPREYPGIFSSFESLPAVSAEKAVSMVLK